MPKVVDKQEKEKQILQAALTVFAQKGFAATKMIDIAKQAQIGKGTLYEYFKHKEDLFFKTFLFLFEHYDQKFQQKLAQLTNPTDKLCLIVQTYFVEFSQKNFEFMEILMDFWMASARQNQKQNFSLLQLYKDYRNLISQILQDGIKQKQFRPHHTEHYASMLLAILDGLFLQLFLDKKVFDLQEMASSICEMFFNSLILRNGDQ